jgi:hypothetical protein
VVLSSRAVACCELGLAFGDVAIGFCEPTCCGCWIDSGAAPAIVVSCPQQACHASKTGKAVSDSNSDLNMTLIVPSPDRISRS